VDGTGDSIVPNQDIALILGVPCARCGAAILEFDACTATCLFPFLEGRLKDAENRVLIALCETIVVVKPVDWLVWPADCCACLGVDGFPGMNRRRTEQSKTYCEEPTACEQPCSSGVDTE
jgi:hypothetical protein